MKTKQKTYKIGKVIDLFCGIGGLTHGFLKEGFDVVAGIDNDDTCRYGYESNNKAKFIHKAIEDVDAKEIKQLYGDPSDISVLVGCAPCQPYSKLNTSGASEEDFGPIMKFAELISKVKPDIVSMENVRGVAKYPVFKKFLANLDKNGYEYDYKIVNTADYGVPQRRMRLVLLASRLGPIKLLEQTHDKNNWVTVHDAIGDLEIIKDGEISNTDLLHRSRKLSHLNKKRIKATPKDGGNSKSWDKKLLLDCHKKTSGKTYRSTVYGRMRWDEPAPTMTTQCTGLGNGRFGHPEQDRAISLREAAMFQTFPKNYKFYDNKSPYVVSDVARFIGNAVPVKLGQVIAKSIKRHLMEVK